MKKNLSLSNLKLRKQRDYLALKKPQAATVKTVKDEIFLTGEVRGKKASAPEEMFARTLDKYGKNYVFRYIIPVVQGVTGMRGEHELDFLIYDGVLKPVQIGDMSFVHKSAEQKQIDFENDIAVNTFLKQYGALPVVWLDADFLKTDATTDLKAREMLLV